MLPVVQVERRTRRQVQQLCVLLLALHPRVRPGERILEVVRDMLVELVVLLVGDLRLRPRPQRRGLVHRLALGLGHVGRSLRIPALLVHAHRQGDVVGVLADHVAQAHRVEEIVLALAQVQRDLGAAYRPVDRLQRVFAVPGRFPAYALRRWHAGAARTHRHPVGDDEGRIEADAELTDQVRVLRLVAREPGQELARAGFRDRAQVVDDLLAGHADAIVGDGDGARGRVEADVDAKVGIALEQRAVGERLEAQLVAGVGRIRDQLAQEDFLVAVERMHHQVQQLLHLGLETQGLASACGRRGIGGVGRVCHGILRCRRAGKAGYGDGLPDFNPTMRRRAWPRPGHRPTPAAPP